MTFLQVLVILAAAYVPLLIMDYVAALVVAVYEQLQAGLTIEDPAVVNLNVASIVLIIALWPVMIS